MVAPDYVVKAGAPPANLEDAVTMFQRISPIAHQCGFMVALYGSVVTKQFGMDVDMFAVPGRPVGLVDARLLVARIQQAGFHQIGDPYAGLAGTFAVVFRDNFTGKILDLQIREVAPPSWETLESTIARSINEQLQQPSGGHPGCPPAAQGAGASG